MTTSCQMSDVQLLFIQLCLRIIEAVRVSLREAGTGNEILVLAQCKLLLLSFLL
jgi:hypothetical protein